MKSKYNSRPTAGDKVVVMGENNHGPIIMYYAMFVADGWGLRGGRGCTDGFIIRADYAHSEWSPITESNRWCVVAVPYLNEEGRLIWRPYSAPQNTVRLDCMAVRMVDETSREAERAERLQRMIANAEVIDENHIAERKVKKFLGGVGCAYYGVDYMTVCALLVASGLMPEIDFDAQRTKQVTEAMVAFKKQTDVANDSRVDF